jgi:hypothetical protein
MRSKSLQTLLCVFFISASSLVHAQDIDQLLKDNIDDGRKLVGAYISPFMKSLSVGMNQGWYNTAKAHKIAGVDLTFTVSALTIPDKESFYDATTLGLKGVSLNATGADRSPDYPLAPTMFGPDLEPVFRVNSSGETFRGPGGLGIKEEIGRNIMPVPMAHLGFGLPKGTDVKIRFIPTINLGDDGELKLFGLGVMHDIKQYIPGIKHLPFDLSGFAGFTRFSLNYRFDTEGGVAGQDQRAEFVVNSTTLQGLISKKFSVLTLYGGIGYNVAKSNLAVKGTFDINDNGTIEADERDPLDLRYGASGPRATAGFRLKLAVLTLHADYTLQKYNALTVGIGLSVR